MHSGMDDPNGPGFPIRTSQDHCLVTSSPGLFAGSDVLHRLLTPRHPPHALGDLTTPTAARLDHYFRDGSRCRTKASCSTVHPHPGKDASDSIYKSPGRSRHSRSSTPVRKTEKRMHGCRDYVHELAMSTGEPGSTSKLAVPPDDFTSFGVDREGYRNPRACQGHQRPNLAPIFNFSSPMSHTKHPLIPHRADQIAFRASLQP